MCAAAGKREDMRLGEEMFRILAKKSVGLYSTTGGDLRRQRVAPSCLDVIVRNSLVC